MAADFFQIIPYYLLFFTLYITLQAGNGLTNVPGSMPERQTAHSQLILLFPVDERSL